MMENFASMSAPLPLNGRSRLLSFIILWLAVGLLFASQFFGVVDGQPYRNWFFKDLWFLIERCWREMTGGEFSYFPLMALFVGVFTAIVIVLAPWLVEVLARAKPWLWILRVLATAALLWILWDLRSMIEFSEISEKPLPYLTGYWLFLTSIVLNTVGLWLIPGARKFA
jgi:hypothetical protein